MTSALDTARGVLAYLSWRLGLVTVMTIPLFLGGVWVVVDLSLRGVEKAIETTNIRISDLRTDVQSIDNRVYDRLSSKFESVLDRINKLEKEIKIETTSIKDFMKRVNVENENLALAFWTLDKIEIGYPTSLNMPSLDDFVTDLSYKDLKKNLVSDQAIALSDIKIVPLVDDGSFLSIRTQNINLADYVVTTRSDYLQFKSAIQRMSDCVRIKQLSSQKIVIQPTNTAVILNGTVGCPVATISALKFQKNR